MGRLLDGVNEKCNSYAMTQAHGARVTSSAGRSQFVVQLSGICPPAWFQVHSSLAIR
jgi:hypothetical protein